MDHLFNIWIRSASLIFNGVWFFKAEHQIISFFICSGVDPTKDFKKPINIYSVIEIGSVLFFLIVWIRVKFFKRSASKIENHDKRPTKWKKVFLAEVNYESLAYFTTSMVDLSIILFLLFSSAYLGKIRPEDMHNYQTILHMQYLVAPCFACLTFVAVYYLRHGPLRKAVFSKILDMYMDLKEF